jgi:adenine phosphoribosyltransferase
MVHCTLKGNRMEHLKKFIADVPDFPKEGVLFKDVTPLLGNPKAFMEVTTTFAAKWDGKADAVAALDARGFLFGGALALVMGVPLVMIRKKGKLPGKTHAVTYDLEYGTDTLEVRDGAFEKSARVLIVDDLLATGGTAAAAGALVEKTGATVAGLAFVIELTELGGRNKLGDYPIHALIHY